MSSANRYSQLAVFARLLAMGLIILSLWNLTSPVIDNRLDVILMVDHSSSVDTDHIDHAWLQIRGAMRRLSSDVSYSLINFSATAEVIARNVGESTLARQLNTDWPLPDTGSNGTNIAAAIDLALTNTRNGRPTCFILISDGAETSGNSIPSLKQIASDRISVYSLWPEMESAIDQVRIEQMMLPHQLQSGAASPVSVTIAGNSEFAGQLRATIDGRTVQTRRFDVQPGQPSVLRFLLDFPDPGNYEVGFLLSAPGDPVQHNNTIANVVNVTKAPPIVVVQRHGEPTTISSSLLQSNRDVRTVSPARLTQQIGSIPATSTWLLDNIAATDLTENNWASLARRVRNDGAGLIVFGGDRSFGAGGYRNSMLEQLLPVTAESRVALPPVAMLFVIDKSGSMDSEGSLASRFESARKAVLSTATSLMPGDMTGLIAFDSSAHTWLPLDRYIDPPKALGDAWSGTPSGGTELRPAVTAAIAQLGKLNVKERFLVLVTDGFAVDEELDDEILQLAQSGITPIALAVGRDPQVEVLRKLSAPNNGALLLVDDVATLPQIMSSTFGQRRLAYESSKIKPIRVMDLPIPGIESADWPALNGYMVTRERDDAQVYLRSSQGDPLLASHLYGFGRVIAVPALLPAFIQGQDEPEFWSTLAGGLADWASSAYPANNLHLLQADSSHAIFDALTADGNWDIDIPVTAYLTDDASRTKPLRTSVIAPGRHLTTLPDDLEGAYQLSVQLEDQSISYDFMHLAASESQSRQRGRETLSRWSDLGLIKSWPPDNRLEPISQLHSRKALRPFFLTGAVLLYFTVIVIEKTRGISSGLNWTRYSSQFRNFAHTHWSRS